VEGLVGSKFGIEGVVNILDVCVDCGSGRKARWDLSRRPQTPGIIAWRMTLATMRLSMFETEIGRRWSTWGRSSLGKKN
jgi:hypothetical protein